MRRTGQRRLRNGNSQSVYSGHCAARHRRRLRVEPLEDRRLLAVITVQTDQDVVDFNDGVTSLREAIFAANIVPGADTIEFDFGHDGPAAIVLRHGELKITDALAIHGQGAGLLTIDASGNDPTPELHNADGSRVFHIDNGKSQQFEVSIRGVTLTGGDAPGVGGAILNRENLSLSEVVVKGNSAHGAFDGGGGGIFSGAGKLSITKSTIQENYSSSYGGGIDVDRGAVEISNTIIRNNGSFYTGAGIRIAHSEAEISQSVIRGNRGMAGGGIHNDSGNVVVRASWIAENSTGGLGPHFGGGIYNSFGTLLVVDSTISNNMGTKGAGIANLGGERLATVRNSTISGNVADGGGGGIYNISGKIVVEFSTITDNSAPENWGGGVASNGEGSGFRATHTEIYSSIVSGNDSSNADIVNGDANTIQSRGFNLVGRGNASSAFILEGDLHVSDPKLGPLTNNGGRELPGGQILATHVLRADSQALNAGNPNDKSGQHGVPAYDQRGTPYARVASERIDIGATERQSVRRLMGDFDGSGLVDNADYVLWRQAAGQSGEIARMVDSRGNGDGQVDQWDRMVWLANFGQTDAAMSAVAATAPVLTESMAGSNRTVDGRALGPINLISAPSVAAETNVSRPQHRPAVRATFVRDTALLLLVGEQPAATRQALAVFAAGAGDAIDAAWSAHDESSAHDAALGALFAIDSDQTYASSKLSGQEV